MKLEVVHLSDVHLYEKNLKDFGYIRKALIARLKDAIAGKGAPPDIVVFSGDLVQAGGSKSDFDRAHSEFLEPLFSEVGLDFGRFFLVPGNHDINRETVRSDPILEGGQRSSLKTREGLSQFIDRNLGRSPSYHFSRLNEYFEYRTSRAFAKHVRTTPFFTSHRVDLAAGSIGIACLNTAWRCTGEAEDVDYGQLLLGERSIAEALKDLDHTDIKLAIFHHPIPWLRSFDQDDCKPLLLKEFDLIMTGHCHRSRPESVSTPTGRAVLSEGGALYVKREYFNGFCWITLDRSSGLAEFKLWRYEDQNAMYSFEPATNVAPAGTYVVRLNSDEIVSQFVNVERACRLLRPFLQENADKHMLSNYADTDAPKTIDELYVPPSLSERSQFQPAKEEEASSVAEEGILSSDIPTLVLGPRESGKTTIGWRLCLLAAQAEKQRIPVYLDLAKIKAGTDYLLRAMRQYFASAGANVEIEAELKKGALFIIFDNLPPKNRDGSSKRKVEMVETFLQTYPSNRAILLALEEEATTAKVVKAEHLSISHKKIYIHPLSRVGVKALTARWLEPAGLNTSKNVEAVLDKIRVFNLPRTAHVVSMVLWTIEKEKSPGPVNEASLLQRFVEANLNKANPSEIERSALDFLIKETFLSQLAVRMREQGLEFIGKNDVVQFAIDFFKARSWIYDASAFVEELVRIGVLVHFSTEDGPQLEFRYGCLQEYFVARFMQENASYADKLIETDQYVHYSRELDFLTGLTRNNAALMQKLIDKVGAIATAESLSVEKRLIDFKNIRFDSDGVGMASLDIMSSIETTPKTDAEIDALMDEVDTPPTVNKQPSRREMNSPLARYFLTTQLLSKVVRNNELVDNEGLKLAAVEKAAEGWSYLAAEGLHIYEQMKAGELPEVKRHFDELPEPEKASAEIFLKVLWNIGMAAMANDALKSDKLYVVLQKAYENTNKDNTLKRYMLLNVLLSLGFSHAVPKYVVDQAIQFIKDTNNSSILFLLTFALFAMYMNPYLGADNRRQLEQIMLQLKLKVAGVTKPGPIRDRMSSLFIEEIKKVRGQVAAIQEDAKPS